MSREKWLWISCGALAALSAVLALLLVLSWNSSEDHPPAPPISGDTGDPGRGAGDAPPSAPKKIAQAGAVVLLEDDFLEGLQRSFGTEYVQRWLKRTVVRLEAQALGINITRAEIDAELERMQTGYESKAEFFRVMETQLGLTEQELRDDALYRLMLEEVATSQVQVTEADVEAYIEQHPEEFAPVDDVRFAKIVVESKERANLVLQRLAEGVAFDILAKDVSLDEATSFLGGDSGWIAVDDPFVPDEIAEALQSMKVGDVSPPIMEDEDEWTVLTLLGRRTINPLDDSNVRKELRRELALAQAPSLFDVEEILLKKYSAVDFTKPD